MAKLEACFYGFGCPYEDYLALMHKLHARIAHEHHSDHLMLLEHRPVITLTRQHQERSLISSADAIKNSGIDLCEADRGGDATFHGPGQLVGYPLININKPLLSIESYIRALEKSLLNTVRFFGLSCVDTIPGFTGLWLKHKKNKNLSLKKVCALGVGIKDGVTKHGFALNISINAEPFTKHIIPCGLRDRGVATLEEAFSQEHLEMPDYLVIVKSVCENIAQTFSRELCLKGLNYG